MSSQRPSFCKSVKTKFQSEGAFRQVDATEREGIP